MTQPLGQTRRLHGTVKPVLQTLLTFEGTAQLVKQELVMRRRAGVECLGDCFLDRHLNRHAGLSRDKPDEYIKCYCGIYRISSCSDDLAFGASEGLDADQCCMFDQ